MPKMTRARARFLIVSMLRDGWEQTPATNAGMIAQFHQNGLACDDNVTTWNDVFFAADVADWERKTSNDSDRAEASAEARETKRASGLSVRDLADPELSIDDRPRQRD